MDPNTIPPQQPQQPTPPQPVAYDAEGRPLYHHPPIAPPAVNTIPPQQLQQTQSYGAGQSPQVQATSSNRCARVACHNPSRAI